MNEKQETEKEYKGKSLEESLQERKEKRLREKKEFEEKLADMQEETKRLKEGKKHEG